jgi:PIN domain nuclease of toxin-antitoxin system
VTPATSQVVADTHVLVWYLTDSARLSSAAQQALEGCVADDHPIVVNSISLVELVYAAEKAKSPVTVDQRDYIFEVLDRDDSPFIVVPTTPAIARAMAAIDRQVLSDPADRTIAATAIAMNLTAVSSDDRLRKAGERGLLSVIW